MIKWLKIKLKQVKWILIQPAFRRRKKKEYIDAYVKAADIKAQMMAPEFDKAFIAGVQGKRKYMHYRNMMIEPEFIYSNHKDREGFATSNLDYARAEMKRRGIDYMGLSVEEVYEAMGD